MATNEQGMRFRIGVFVMMALLLLAVLIILFNRVPTFFQTADRRYQIVFDYAPGVSVNTPVRRSGIRIGQVEKVDLDDATGKVTVFIVIDRGRVLFEDDQPQLVPGALSGDTTIDFVPRTPPPEPPKPEPQRSQGQPAEITRVSFELAQQQPAPTPPPARQPAPPGKTFQGVTQSDVAGVLDAFAEMRKTLRSFDKVRRLTEETLPQIRDLAKDAREVMPQLRQTNDQVRQLAEDTRKTLPDLQRTNSEILAGARTWNQLGERLNTSVLTNEKKFVEAVDNFNKTFEYLNKKLPDTLHNFDDTLARIDSFLSKENQRRLESLLQNTNDLVKQGQGTVQRVNDAVGQAHQILTDVQQATKPLAGRSESILRNLDESTLRLNKTLAEAFELLRTLNQADGTLHRFLADPTLYNNLNEAACLLTRVVPRIDRILKDVEVFADKIARHPESLGIGGAVRPSSGLKGSPTQSWTHDPDH